MGLVAAIFCFEYAFSVSLCRKPSTAVPSVLHLGSGSKVRHPVIPRLTVYMV
jgi:hypothetical protein